MSGQIYENQFNRADANHDGTIDEREFRQFLGPVIKDERRLSGTLTQQDVQAIVNFILIIFHFLLLFY
jgi:Ca2+-binding EF-hand superfamily protein